MASNKQEICQWIQINLSQQGSPVTFDWRAFVLVESAYSETEISPSSERVISYLKLFEVK